jgi:hypothetical protein
MWRGALSKSVKPFAWLASVGEVPRRAPAQASGDETVQGVKKVGLTLERSPASAFKAVAFSVAPSTTLTDQTLLA